MIFGKTIIAVANEKGIIISSSDLMNQIVIQIILSIIIFFIFLLIYMYTSKNNNYRKHYYGAMFASISFNIISFIFSKYLEIFKGFSVFYGSLTTLILIMMWTYSCFYVIFLGAEINKFNNIKKEENVRI